MCKRFANPTFIEKWRAEWKMNFCTLQRRAFGPSTAGAGLQRALLGIFINQCITGKEQAMKESEVKMNWDFCVKTRDS